METLTVIGCGTMGHSIALSAAWGGFPVNLVGISEEELATARGNIEKKLFVMVENELFGQVEATEILARITFYTDLQQAVQETTFIIEAIPEVLQLKHALYANLEPLIGENVVIASNTSGFKPTSLAAHLKHPERFIVAHYWNPAHLIPLVEVVKGEHTNEPTIERTMSFMKAMNKQAVLIQKEILGFIGNRMQYALFREAQAILASGAATVEDIDIAVKASIGRRLGVTGPFMTADMGGLDVFSSISNYLFEDLSKADTSSEAIMQLVNEGKLGDKTGQGFYTWDEETSKNINAEREQMLIYFLKKEQGDD